MDAVQRFASLEIDARGTRLTVRTRPGRFPEKTIRLGIEEHDQDRAIAWLDEIEVLQLRDVLDAMIGGGEEPS